MVNKPVLDQLCAATRHLVRSSGGQEAAASITRVRHQALSDYGNKGKDQFIPVDVVADLMLDSGDIALLQAVARMIGCEVVQLPQMPQGFAELQMAMGKTSKEVGEVFTRIGESLADGTFDKGERRATTDEINEAIGALVALRQVVEAG